jgi:hypothetical protein
LTVTVITRCAPKGLTSAAAFADIAPALPSRPGQVARGLFEVGDRG